MRNSKIEKVLGFIVLTCLSFGCAPQPVKLSSPPQAVLIQPQPVQSISGLTHWEYAGFGANKCVSGAMHFVGIDGTILMLDAGLFYGKDGEKIGPPPLKLLQGNYPLLLSHAHLDHIGRLPDIIRMGYKGQIYCLPPTKALMPTMLYMAVRYGDFGPEHFYYSESQKRKKAASGEMLTAHFSPYCKFGGMIHSRNRGEFVSTRKELEQKGFNLCFACQTLEVDEIMSHVKAVEANSKFKVGNVEAEYIPTPHIPGAASIRLAGLNSKKTLLYSGDLGSGTSPFLPAQQPLGDADYLIVEGTYGTAVYPPNPLARLEFQKYIGEQIKMGKRVVIPAFVLDRSQQVLAELSAGLQSGTIPKNTKIKMYSPNAVRLTDLYLKLRAPSMRAYFSDAFITKGPYPKSILTAQKKRGQLEDLKHGEIGITSSGMADYASSLESVKTWVEDPNTVFVLVGYQDPDSIGSSLLRNAHSTIVIDGQAYSPKGEVRKFDCFSAHANYGQIRDLVKGMPSLKKALLVHSDFTDDLKAEYSKDFPGVDFVAPESWTLLNFN